MSGDYGPVPISRLKDEAARMSDALRQGRRVLISRQGRVVAQIEPASTGRHAEALASFAVDAATAPRAISPSLLSKGAGSDAVHAAENGEIQLLTRNSKVLGVLSRFAPSDNWDALMERERAMKVTETVFPDATPEQFATVVDNYTQPDRSEAIGVANRQVAAFRSSTIASSLAAALVGVGATSGAGIAVSALAQGAVGAIAAYRRAQFARATALQLLGEAEAAETALRSVVATLEEEPSPMDEGIAVKSYLALADIYFESDRPEEALDSAELAIQHLRLATAGAGD